MNRIFVFFLVGFAVVTLCVFSSLASYGLGSSQALPTPTATPKAPALDRFAPLPYLEADLGERVKVLYPRARELNDLIVYDNRIIFDFSTTDGNTGWMVIYVWKDKWVFLEAVKYNYIPD